MDFMIVLVRVKCVEIRDAMGAENDRFAVEDEVLLADLTSGFQGSMDNGWPNCSLRA